MVGNVRIVPGLPDPRTGRYFKLQVGSFHVLDHAKNWAQYIRNAGFYVTEEQHGDLHRVVLVDIPAAQIHSMAQRLATAGVREIWIRE
jgi:cell division septation protein DedD